MKDPNFKLDEWDIKLIRYLKGSVGSSQPKLSDLKILWGERNSIEPEHIDTQYIVEWMLEILLQLNLEPLMETLLYDTHPDNQWKFGLEGDGGDRHWENWARVLASRLMLTEVSKLPGYVRAPKQTKPSLLALHMIETSKEKR